jgi:uncharacterized protein (TIGR02466 family)
MEQTKRRVEHIFAYPLFTTYIDNNVSLNLLDYIKDLKQKGHGEQRNPYYWQSKDNLQTHEYISEFVNICKAELSGVFDYLKVEYEDIEINNMWANITKNDYYHSLHVHPNSFYSGLIYLQVPKYTMPTTLANPHNMFKMIEPNYTGDTVETRQSYDCYPEFSKMALWDSTIPHMVPNDISKNPNEERISLAFTAIAKGQVKGHTIKYNY